MDLNARVDVNCGREDGWLDRQTDLWKTGLLYRTLLKQVQQKLLNLNVTIDGWIFI